MPSIRERIKIRKMINEKFSLIENGDLGIVERIAARKAINEGFLRLSEEDGSDAINELDLEIYTHSGIGGANYRNVNDPERYIKMTSLFTGKDKEFIISALRAGKELQYDVGWDSRIRSGKAHREAMKAIEDQRRREGKRTTKTSEEWLSETGYDEYEQEVRPESVSRKVEPVIEIKSEVTEEAAENVTDEESKPLRELNAHEKDVLGVIRRLNGKPVRSADEIQALCSPKLLYKRFTLSTAIGELFERKLITLRISQNSEGEKLLYYSAID